jgi:hypothetical protein
VVTDQYSELSEGLTSDPVKLASIDFVKPRAGTESTRGSGLPPPAGGAPPPTKCYKRRVNIFGWKTSIWRFRRSTDTIACIFLTLGIIFFVLAFALPAIIDSLLKGGVASSLSIESKHTDSYDMWEEQKPNADNPVQYDIYMFDVVNANDVMCNGPGGPYDAEYSECPGSVPQLIERGPYAYKKAWKRFDVSWSDHGEKISYIEQDYYEFDAERTGPGLSEQDMITTPSLAANLVKNMLEQGADQYGPKEIMDYVHSMSSNYRKFAYEDGKLSFNEIEEGAQSIEKLGNMVSKAMISIPMHGNGWRLLLKLILCAAPPAGPSQFHTRPMHDLYWGYWGDPLISLLGSVISTATGEPFMTYLAGFATNYTTEEYARRLAYGKTTVHTGKTIEKIHDYETYMGMEYLYVCLSPDESTGDEELKLPAVCPQFDLSWTQEEAATNGYYPPWHSPEEVKIKGHSDCNGFAPFHGEDYPGAGVPKKWKSENRNVFISDIYRSFPLKHSSTYEWHGVKLDRLQIRQQDMESSNCSWAWPEDKCNPGNADYDAFGPAGLLNLTTLSAGVQLFASKPHFLDGHPWLVNQFGGALKPKDAIHQTYIDVEPFTGDPLRLAERLQLVLKVDNWNLPSTNLYTYFGWDPAIEKEIISEDLEKAYIAIRDATINVVEKKIEEKLFGDGGLCPTSQQKHFQHCEEMVVKLETYIYHLLQEWCTGTYPPSTSPVPAPTMVPQPAPTMAPIPAPTTTPPTAHPTALPSAAPTLLPVPAPTSATGVEEELSSMELFERQMQSSTMSFPVPTLPQFNTTDDEKGLICAVIDWGWETIIEPHKIAHVIEQAKEYCQANPGTCAQFEDLARQKIEAWVEKKCGGDIDKKTAVECKLGMAAVKGAASVFTIASNFCNSGVCDLVEKFIEFVNGTSLVAAKDKECAKLKENRVEFCGNMEAYAEELISTECVKNINWTFSMSGISKTITAQKICEIVDTVVLENDFDDNVKTDDKWVWGDDLVTLPHGVFWKKADAYCSCQGARPLGCSIQQGVCNGARTEAQQKLPEACANKPTACAAGKYIIENWESIDNKIMNITNRYHEWCETDPCTRLGLEPDKPIQQKVTAALLNFCNVTSFVSDDILPPAPYSEHPWLHLAEACPTIVKAVEDAKTNYCSKGTLESIECEIIYEIPWNTPIDENGGPILAFIEDVLIPKVDSGIAKIETWCNAQPLEQLPQLHQDICKALGPLVIQEFEAVFNAAIAAIDSMVPQFNISSIVTTAEEYLTCALGEATSPGIDSEGYYFPLCWADEWMDVPREDTRLVKEDVYATQTVSHQIQISFLIIAGIFGVFVALVIVIRQYTKGDYESEDRLLNRELVARKGDVSDPFADPYDFSAIRNGDDDNDDDDDLLKNPLSDGGSVRSGDTGNAWV